MSTLHGLLEDAPGKLPGLALNMQLFGTEALLLSTIFDDLKMKNTPLIGDRVEDLGVKHSREAIVIGYLLNDGELQIRAELLGPGTGYMTRHPDDLRVIEPATPHDRDAGLKAILDHHRSAGYTFGSEITRPPAPAHERLPSTLDWKEKSPRELGLVSDEEDEFTGLLRVKNPRAGARIVEADYILLEESQQWTWCSPYGDSYNDDEVIAWARYEEEEPAIFPAVE